MNDSNSFYAVVTRAVADIADRGYDPARVDRWMIEIAAAAARDMVPLPKMQAMLKAQFKGMYKRLIENGGILKYHEGISRFTLNNLKSKLRPVMDRAVMASAQMIVLNREASIQKTLQRFSGWASSVPFGGSDVVDKVETKDTVRKALAQLPFEERRVLIDQGHKFVAALSDILATDGGALAGEWHSHWRQSNYDFREDHKERDMHVYTVRGNWALAKGLMKAGPDGYTDGITGAGEEIFCRCFYRWIYNLRGLPPDMLTLKGKAGLKKAQASA